jgi:hypothetical protein
MWSTIAIRETNNRFHQNFQAGFRTLPLGYKGINLGISIATHLEATTRAKGRMLVKGHVLGRLS